VGPHQFVAAIPIYFAVYRPTDSGQVAWLCQPVPDVLTLPLDFGYYPPFPPASGGSKGGQPAHIVGLAAAAGIKSRFIQSDSIFFRIDSYNCSLKFSQISIGVG
jgi:hypothetical protein